MIFSSRQMDVLNAASQAGKKKKKHPSFVTAVIFKPTVETMTGLYIGRRKRDNSFIIKNVTPNSLASATELSKGMRLLLVNSEPVLPDTMSLQEVAEMLTKANGVVTITCTKNIRRKDPLKQAPSPSNRKKNPAAETPDPLIKPPCFKRTSSNNTHFKPPSEPSTHQYRHHHHRFAGATRRQPSDLDSKTGRKFFFFR